MSTKQLDLLDRLATGKAGMAYVRETPHAMRTLRSLQARGFVTVSGDYYADQRVTGEDVAITATEKGRDALTLARGAA